MAVRRALRTKVTSSTTGTGTLTLAAPLANLRGPAEQFGAGPVKVAYCISGATYFEIGFGTFTSAGSSLTRDTVLESSNSDALVNLPAGTHDVLFWDPGGPLHIAATGTITLAADDFGGGVTFTGSSAASANLPALALLPAGWAARIANQGTADLTIDPNGAETINSAATLVLKPGEAADAWKADSGWFAVLDRIATPPAEVLIATQTLAASASAFDFDLAGYARYRLRFDNLVHSAAEALLLRFSNDGGATFIAGALDYHRAGVYNGAAVASGYGDIGGSALSLSMPVPAGARVAGVCEFTPGSASTPAELYFCQAHGLEPSSNYLRMQTAAGRRAANGAVDAMRLFVATGTFSAGGRASLYGVRA